MKSFLLFLSCFFFMDCTEFSQKKQFTKSQIQQVIQNRPWSGLSFKVKTYTGCEVVPATGKKPMFENMEFTGKTCSVTVHSDQKISVSFVNHSPQQPALLENQSDTYVMNVDSENILLIQQKEGEVISATHTNYDNQGNLNYGQSGSGNFITSCLLSESEPCTY